jgi:ABC-type bacteriocin/lantibiotic exporter with double-glycine peptidase domain
MPRVAWLSTSLDHDCGPACLAMVLGYHGSHASIDAMREKLGTSRDGTTGLDLVRVARAEGMEARGYRVEDPSALRDVPLPLIAHYTSGHFVVVERYRAGRDVRVVDPVAGRLVLSAAEFHAQASGVIVTLAPGAGFRPVRDGSLQRFAVSTLHERWPLVLGLIAISLVFQGIAFAVPALVAFVVDRIIPSAQLSFLALAVAGIPIFAAGYALSAWLRGRAMSALVGRVSRAWLDRLYRHMLRLPLSYFQGRPVQDLVIRVQGVDLVLDEMLDQVVAGALDTLLAITALIALVATYPQISALVVGAIIVQAVIGWIAQRQAVDTFVRDMIAHARLYTFTSETLAGIADVKMIGPAQLGPAWQKLLDERVEAGAQRRRRSALWDGLLAAAQATAPLLVLVAGAGMAIRGDATIGAVVGFYALSGVCLAPVARLVTSAYHFRSMTQYLRRAYEVLEHPPEAQNNNALGAAANVRGDIELVHVSHRYAPQGDDVVRDVNLTIRAGETLVIVGPTGSGKSTLARIIATLYEPTSGELRVDGFPISHFDRDELRRRFGVVFQEDTLIAGTLLDNITFGRNLPVERVYDALETACLLDDVRAMSLGLATPVGSRGLHLSGGQRQRLCLARAVVHDPAVLVLDEATSAIDRLTEHRIYEKLRALSCTTIMVTHRLYVAKGADRIAVLERGAVVECGSHDDLVRSGGLYARMSGARVA